MGKPGRVPISADTALTDFERIFIFEYCKCFNRAKAYRQASGADAPNAPQLGHHIYHKPNVKAAIQKAIADATLKSVEVTKLISDMANASVSDYMKFRKVPYTPFITITLEEYIAGIREDLERDKELNRRYPLEMDEYDDWKRKERAIIRNIQKLEIELERDPEAVRIVKGKTRLVDQEYIDMRAVKRDREGGKIKSFKMTKDGPHIEFYSALEAAREVAKMHGNYSKDNAQKVPKNSIDPSSLSTSALKELMNAARNANT